MTDINMPARPPKPLQIVYPGWEIPEGAYRSFDDDNGWQPVPEFEVGTKARRDIIRYAELLTPDLYRAARLEEAVAPEDLYWQGGRYDWMPVRPRAYELRGTVEEVRERIGEQFFFVAKLDETNDDSRTVPLPEHHRPLMPGELIRGGDKVIYNGVREWIIETDRYMYGRAVNECTEQLGYMRMCRPMGEQAIFLYVEKLLETDKKTGETSARYPSQDDAKAMLERHTKHLAESSAERHRKQVVGAVLTHHGDVLFASDPEPRVFDRFLPVP